MLLGASQPPLRVSRGEAITIAAVTVAFALALVLWALLTPAFGAPDEINHFDAVVQLALGHGWPDPARLHFLNATLALKTEAASVAAADRPSFAALLAAHPGTGLVNQMSQHPPTWYALAAGALRLVGFEERRWDLALLVVRLVNVALLAALPLVLWAAVRRVTRSPRAALVGAVAVFLVPQVGFIGASASNDPPVVVLGAVVVWLACRVLTGDRSWWTLAFLVLAASAAAACKATALPLVPFAVLAVVLSTRGRSRWLRGGIALVVPVVLTSWWWVRNVLVFHTLQPAGLPSSIERTPFDPGEGPDLGNFANTFWNRVINSFWGHYGPLAYPTSPIVINVLTITALGVLLVWAFRRGPHRAIAWCLAVLPLLTLASGLQNNWSTYLRTTGMGGIQGRYYFVTLGALAVLSAIAWLRFVRDPGSRRSVGVLVTVGSVAMTLYGFTRAYRGFYEDDHLAVSAGGLRVLARSTPVGTVPFAAEAGLTVLALLAVCVLTVLAIRSRALAVPASEPDGAEDGVQDHHR
jgi:4-amino-4-deoxy-L-arabinose transferase-like glycosyltransferase